MSDALRTGHIFVAAGGGILADLIEGHIPLLAVEYNPKRCALIRHRYPGIEVAEGDVRQMDFREWNGKLDLIHAGIPCPRWSTARHSVGDPDDLTEEVVRVISEIKPTWFFLECVPGFSREHSRIRKLFRDIGYSLSSPFITSASAVGAPIIRKRYWSVGRSYENGKPVFPVHAKAPRLPSPDPTPWQVEREEIQVADGVADRWELECVGDGQCPLQAVLSLKLLGVK